MGTAKQIVYNYKRYLPGITVTAANAEGSSTATDIQQTGTVLTSSTAYSSVSGLDIYSSTGLDAYCNTSSPWTKIAIQAEPGTIFHMNNQEMMVGRSGYFEFDDDDIQITSLYFDKPERYRKDEASSQELIQTGLEDMKTAIDNFLTPTAGTGFSAMTSSTGEIATNYDVEDGVLARYNNFIVNFNSAIKEYDLGKSGLYEKLSTKSADLENVIIDYVVN